jgi:PPM family protein phosphatase
MVGSYEIAGLLSIGEDDIHETARRLVDLANESGGRDNISVILVRVREPSGPAAAAPESPVSA